MKSTFFRRMLVKGCLLSSALLCMDRYYVQVRWMYSLHTPTAAVARKDSFEPARRSSSSTTTYFTQHVTTFERTTHDPTNTTTGGGVPGTIHYLSTHHSSSYRRRPSREWLSECKHREKQRPSQPFQVVWPGYTLGDCVKLCQKCQSSIQAASAASTTTNAQFPTSSRPSLAEEYYKRACRRSDEEEKKSGGGDLNNLTLLEELLDQFEVDHYLTISKPDPNDLVIHLRLGDVIDKASATIDQMLIEGANPKHPGTFDKGIKSVYEYLDNLEAAVLANHNRTTDDDNDDGDDGDDDGEFPLSKPAAAIPRKIILMGGSHKPEFYKKSRVYAACLQQSLVAAGYTPVELRIEGSNPDVDFFYMSQARHLLVSAGGYSRLVGQMVLRKGGRIVGRSFG